MRTGIEAALRGLHGQLVGGSVGVVSEGTIQTWLAVHLAGVFEPARVAAEVAFRAAHPERQEPERPDKAWLRHHAAELGAKSEARVTALHNKRNRLEVFHDLVVLRDGPAGDAVERCGKIGAIIEIKATNSADIKRGHVRDDAKVAALSARWLDHLANKNGTSEAPAVLPVVVVVATYSKARRTPTAPSDTQQVLNWLRNDRVPGVVGFVVDGEGVHSTDAVP